MIEPMKLHLRTPQVARAWIEVEGADHD